MSMIIAKKLEMSQIFNEKGGVEPVTWLSATPCKVTALRTSDTDGYVAVQVGLTKKSKNASDDLKPSDFAKRIEFRLPSDAKVELNTGDVLAPDQFKAGDKVEITGTTKGKGFQGVVKRHGFGGAPASHGTKHTLRAPGSIGQRFPQHVRKGLRMAGRMGSDTKTVKNVTVVAVDTENNAIAVRGQVPGSRGSIVKVSMNS